MMDLPRVPSLPETELSRLGFLIGEYHGLESLFPPGGGEPIHFESHVCGTRELCMRFVCVEFFADIPGLGIATFCALLSFHVSSHQYRAWALCRLARRSPIDGGRFRGR